MDIGRLPMAQMYPTSIDPATISQAERKLYTLFRDQLDDSYLVFHSVKWVLPDERGNACDGEADFVIVHPTQGILVLEVKGGRIARNMRNGTWTTTNYEGNTFTIKNPLQQSRGNKYKLLAALRASLKQYILIGYAVAFPDIQVGSQKLGLDFPQEILLDRSHLSSLAI
jgi:Nuclease-related domain